MEAYALQLLLHLSGIGCCQGSPILWPDVLGQRGKYLTLSEAILEEILMPMAP